MAMLKTKDFIDTESNSELMGLIDKWKIMEEDFHVGLLRCGKILLKETHNISIYHHQTRVVGVEVRVEGTSTTGNAPKYREELRIQYNF